MKKKKLVFSICIIVVLIFTGIIISSKLYKSYENGLKDTVNVGTVISSFNLTYTSTDINGDTIKCKYRLHPSVANINKRSYTLYPSAADGNILSSIECVKNFNENLLNNPKYENERELMVDSKVVPENGIDLNYVLNNPKEIGEMLSQLNVYLISNGHSLNELTDTPYNP